MKTHELLPCPFCGSDEASLLLPTCTKDSKYNPADRAFPSVFCIGCFMSVPGRDWDHSGDSAIAAWNRRTEPVRETGHAVQGEPVAWLAGEVCGGDASHNTVNVALDNPAPWSALPIGAKVAIQSPQPAEQQPCPEDIREGAPYDDPAFKSLCREHEIWATAAAAQCAVFWEAGKRVAEQQPAPDVAWLVEALCRCRHQASYSIGGEDALGIQLGKVRDIVNETLSTLAAHRKGGDV